MTKFLKNYIKEIELLLKKSSRNWQLVLERNLEIINFLQHERLIHLLVTLFFGLMFILTTLFLWIYPVLVLFVVDLFLIGLLIPYIFHYFNLENGVQKLYRINELIRKKMI